MLLYNVFKNRKSQLISFFWAGFLIFIIAVSLLIVNIFLARSAENKDVEVETNFDDDLMGPVIPIFFYSNPEIITELDKIFESPGLTSDAYSIIEDGLGEFGYDARVNIRRLGVDEIQSLDEGISTNSNSILGVHGEDLMGSEYVDSGDYKETYIYYYDETHFLEIELVIELE